MSKVRFEQDGPLANLILDNPPLNQIDREVITDLIAAVERLEGADDVRAVLVLGADDMRPLIDSFLDMGHRIEALPVPTLAAVHGVCMAGGFELALFCDLLWAAEGTMLGLPETRLGIVPLAGGVERIAARAGLGRARAVALGGDLYDAGDFVAWGVIDRVVAQDDL